VFKPGHGKHGGRASGVPNKVTGQARELAIELVTDPTYLKKFKQRLLSGRINPALEKMAWEFAFGRPRQQLEIDWSESAPLGINTVRAIYNEVAASRKKNGRD